MLTPAALLNCKYASATQEHIHAGFAFSSNDCSYSHSCNVQRRHRTRTVRLHAVGQVAVCPLRLTHAASSQHAAQRGLHRGLWKRRRWQRRQRLVAQASPALAVVHWNSRSPAQAVCLLGQQLQAVSKQAILLAQGYGHWSGKAFDSPALGRGFAHILSGRSAASHLWQLVKHIFSMLAQPVGGRPVGVIEGVPGWQVRLTRGQRRWLGLRPGRLQPIPDAGPVWTPSGLLHLIQSVPAGLWLLGILLLARIAIKTVRQRRNERDTLIKQQTLLTAAKSTDLRVQKNRMLRALGSTVEAEVVGPEVEPRADYQWQDPSEWDPATRQQWDDFMRKSRAFKLRRDQWWEISSGDDTPYHKLAHDKLTREGKLPDYNPQEEA